MTAAAPRLGNVAALIPCVSICSFLSFSLHLPPWSILLLRFCPVPWLLDSPLHVASPLRPVLHRGALLPAACTLRPELLPLSLSFARTCPFRRIIAHWLCCGSGTSTYTVSIPPAIITIAPPTKPMHLHRELLAACR
ncbi:hypothetical protein N7510_004497 [Penicillium lagena]|uniref:uncharacterized protein n=1 Tax=Penicillium lagena TaxID=94218 RepID=UPI002540EBE6|nr:uncharacterized protein N7510_004497 [Penicillium lagena]KAJ5620513.1 hypothetical protein N7510_004497 [Penicillium lagena]